MPNSPKMVDELWNRLAHDHPDYIELSNILFLASHTWPKFGISAAELSHFDPYQVDQIKILLGL